MLTFATRLLRLLWWTLYLVHPEQEFLGEVIYHKI